uniref:F-box domain-containing protein n=2 Tax=Aegilops tauschii subsp. strangulata TaxID=200361 RepID=A0A453N2A7_AEGTS
TTIRHMSCDEGEMSRRRPLSPAVAAAPLEDDNLLSEILLRLPPDPSSLPRASLVSKRWLGLISDPGFSGRFRLHHRSNPPLLGFFDDLRFIPTMAPPNRVPCGHFPSCIDDDYGLGYFIPLGCRHGLVLIFDLSRKLLLVWDPFNVDQHRLAVPPEFDMEKARFSGAVFRAAGDIRRFQVVLVTTETDEQQHPRVIARVYSSETGGWGDRISTPLPSKLPTKRRMVFTMDVLVGHSLYWLFNDRSAKTPILDGILEFDLERRILAVKPVPVCIPKENIWQFQVMQAEGGGLGIFFLSNFSAQLWEMETDCDGAASWVLGRTVELDKLLPIDSGKKKRWHRWHRSIQGFAEYNNVVFLRTHTDLFMIQLESLQFKKVSKTNISGWYLPFESVFVAGIRRRSRDGLGLGVGSSVPYG